MTTGKPPNTPGRFRSLEVANLCWFALAYGLFLVGFWVWLANRLGVAPRPRAPGGLSWLMVYGLAGVVLPFVLLFVTGSLINRPRRHIERRMKAQEKYLAAVFDTSADAIIGLDPDETVRWWNRGAEMLFGYTSEEMVGRKFYAIVPPELKAQGELERLAEIVRRDGFIRNYETQRVAKDGSRLTVALTRTLLRGDHGEILGTSAIVRDITEQRRMERKLARAESLAAMGELAAGLAHEIRNPLAGISGAMQVIAQAMPPGDPRRETVAEIQRQVQRLNKTVDDLVSFARPRPPEPALFQVNTLLEETLSVLKQEPQLEGIEVTTDLQADLPQVMIDPQQMQNVFMNVILNAAQAMPQGGRLTVRSVARDHGAAIAFADTGCGMSREQIEHIFRPFYTTKTRGTGVGLSISQKILESHGGSIEAESAEGAGSTFTILLPIARGNEPRDSRRAAAESGTER